MTTVDLITELFCRVDDSDRLSAQTSALRLVNKLCHQMVIFADRGFAKRDWHPTNLRLCQRGE